MTNVGKFLSRLLGLPVNQQNCIFDYFMDTLSHDIAVAEKEGHYSDAIRDLYGDSVVTLQKSEDFYTDPITHATCSVHSLHVDRGMEWEAALSRLQKAQEEQDFKGGFFESKNMVPGRNATGWLMAIQKEGSPGEFQIWRPNTGYTGSALTYEDLCKQEPFGNVCAGVCDLCTVQRDCDCADEIMCAHHIVIEAFHIQLTLWSSYVEEEMFVP